MAHHPKPWFRKSRGVWYVQIDGKQHNLGADRTQAFELYHRLMTQPRTEPRVASDSVAAVFDAFLEWTGKHRASTTYDWYRDRLQRFLNVIPPDVTVAELKPFHLQKWLDSRPDWSSAYLRGCVNAVQRAFQWAVRMGYIAASPLAHFEKPRAGKREFVITAELYKTVASVATISAMLLTLDRNTLFRDQIGKGIRVIELGRGGSQGDLVALNVKQLGSRSLFRSAHGYFFAADQVTDFAVRIIQVTGDDGMLWTNDNTGRFQAQLGAMRTVTWHLAAVWVSGSM